MLKRNYLALMLILPCWCYAGTWENLWLNKNQQAAQLLEQGKNKEAAALFSSPKWKGVAYYRDKQYDKAYDEFKKDNSPEGLYNQGNALAYMQKYQEAINSYKETLKKDKAYPDAQHNINVLEKLLKQQQQDKNKQQSQENKQSDKNQADKDKTDKSQSGQDKNNSAAKDKNQSNQGSNSQQDNEKKDHSDQSQNQKNNQANNKDNTNNSQQNNQADQKQQMANNPRNGTNGQQQQNPENQNQQNANKDEKNSDQKSPATASYAEQNQKQNPQDKEVQAVLSQIPDDPGGLLRNKFLRDYQNEQQGTAQ